MNGTHRALVVSLCLMVLSPADSTASDETSLRAHDGSGNDQFGRSVAVSGTAAIVGAWLDDDNGGGSGAAYITEKRSGGWIQTAKLLPSAAHPAQAFGISVAMSGSSVIVGATGQDASGDSSGAVYIFERVRGVWTESAMLTHFDGSAGDQLGGSVSISGEAAVAGARLEDARGFESGSAYVFERIGGTWVQAGRLVPLDGTAFDWFGASVSISGDTAIVGAVRDDDNGSDSGSAYVFQKSGLLWVQTQKLTASDGSAGDRFGASVSIDGATAIVGAPGDDEAGLFAQGSVYVFEKIGDVWTETGKLMASDASTGAQFGDAVSVSGATGVIGAHFDADNGTGAGAAYVVEKVDGTWTEIVKLVPSDGTEGDRFGGSVSVSGDTVLVGAHLDDSLANGVDSGSAHVFEPTITGLDLASRPNPAVLGDTFSLLLDLTNDWASRDIVASLVSLADNQIAVLATHQLSLAPGDIIVNDPIATVPAAQAGTSPFISFLYVLFDQDDGTFLGSASEVVGVVSTRGAPAGPP